MHWQLEIENEIKTLLPLAVVSVVDVLDVAVMCWHVAYRRCCCRMRFMFFLLCCKFCCCNIIQCFGLCCMAKSEQVIELKTGGATTYKQNIENKNTKLQLLEFRFPLFCNKFFNFLLYSFGNPLKRGFLTGRYLILEI